MYLFHLMLILLVVILGGASRKRNVTLLTFEKPFLSVFGPHVHQKASSISFKISTLSALPLSFTVPSKLASMSFRVYSQSACVETEIFVTNTTQYYIQRFIILIFIINSSFQLSFENLGDYFNDFLIVTFSMLHQLHLTIHLRYFAGIIEFTGTFGLTSFFEFAGILELAGIFVFANIFGRTLIFGFAEIFEFAEMFTFGSTRTFHMSGCITAVSWRGLGTREDRRKDLTRVGGYGDMIAALSDGIIRFLLS